MIRLRVALIFALIAAVPAVAESQLLPLIGPEAKVVGGINVDRTAASLFGQFLLSQIQEDDADFRKFIEATGFDPRRDLREVVFASASGPTGQHQPGLVLARGTFNGPQIFAVAKTDGSTVSRYKGVDLLKAKGPASYVAILDGSIAIAGDEALVKGAIDRRNSSTSLDAKFAAKVNEVSARYDAWIVSSAPVSQFAGAAPDRNMGGAMRSDAMQAIEQTSGGVRFGNVVEIAGEAVTRSAKDAQALVDVVRFLSGMAQMNREKNPQFGNFALLLDSIQVKADASTVHFSASIPETELEQMLKSKKKVRRAARR